MNIKLLFKKLKEKYAIYKGGEYYIEYLRSCGIRIGKGCTLGVAKTIDIDCSRPYLIEIGNNVRLNSGLTLLTHDFSTMVFKNLYGEMLASSGRIKIGNNVYFGRKVTVLKGVTIGDNCIIGYGSLVIKNIPSGSVVAGSPAKVICSIEDYYNKRKTKSLEEAFELAREIMKVYSRKPVPSDFREEFVYFVSGNEVGKYPDIPIEFQLRAWGDCFDVWVKTHKATYPDFDSFLKAAGIN